MQIELKSVSSTSTASTDVRKFLLALLVDLAGDQNFKKCFKASHHELHHFFWQVKQDGRSACFVEDLLFDTNGNYPHCAQIDEFLQELQLSGVLSRPNPAYRYHDIGVQESLSAAEFKESLSSEQMDSYKQVVEDFKRDLGIRRAPAVMDILTTLTKLGGLLSGHFILKSGKHSGQYLNKDVIYPHTEIMAQVGQQLAELALCKSIFNVDLVIGPEKGGIILAQWTAFAMRYYIGVCPPLAIYAEKNADGFGFNRGYGDMIPNKRVLLVEDIVTTGGSVLEVEKSVIALGGIVTGIVALVNRGGVQIPNLYTLASLDIESWGVSDCPLCKQGVPFNTNVGHSKK